MIEQEVLFDVGRCEGDVVWRVFVVEVKKFAVDNQWCKRKNEK